MLTMCFVFVRSLSDGGGEFEREEPDRESIRFHVFCQRNGPIRQHGARVTQDAAGQTEIGLCAGKNIIFAKTIIYFNCNEFDLILCVSAYRSAIVVLLVWICMNKASDVYDKCCVFKIRNGQCCIC